MGIVSRATGTDAVAIGTRANAAADNATALGSGGTSAATAVRASGTGSVALGGNATAGANAAGTNAIAIGGESSATQTEAIAMGRLATASALNTIAVGSNARADSAEAVAIGTNAVATGGRAVSIGSGNVANGNGAVAIGDPSTATGNGALAQGLDATATGDGAVSLGNTNMVGGGGQAVSVAGTAAQGAVGIGYHNTVTGQGAVGIGNSNTATGQGSVALGNASSVTVAGGVALGDTASSSASNALALGSGAVASNAGAVALGSGSTTAAAVPTSGVTIAGTPYVFQGTNPASTVSVGAVGAERTITNVAAGRISGTSTDAINGSQLFATNSAIDAVNATANKGFFVTTAATGTGTVSGSTSKNISPGATATYTAGNNIAITQNGAEVQIATSATPTFTSVTTGGLTATGPTTLTGGTTIGGSLTLSPATTVNMGNNVITNVATGSNPTDAANVGQVTTLSNTPLTFTGNTGTVDRKLGETLAITGAGSTAGTYSGANLRTAVVGNEVQLQMTDTPVFTSVTTGATTINNAGLTIAGGPSVTSTGINAGNTVITNVAPGVAGTDGVNVNQLTAVSTTANKGWNATTAATGTGTVTGTTVQNIAPGATATYTAGNNIAITQNGAEVQIATSATPTFTSVTTTNLTATGPTVLSGGTTIGGSLTVNPGTTVNMGNNVITNVAAGLNATDAVNLTQLNTATAAVQTHYFSVRDNPAPQQGNYLNDGATGDGAVAAGLNVSASGESSVAMGNVAVASGKFSAAIGLNSSATKQGATAIGWSTDATGFVSTAVGTNSTASGDWSTALGDNTIAAGLGSTAVGDGAIANEARDVALGSGAIATGVPGTGPGTGPAIAIGNLSSATGAGTVALGNAATATGTGSLALGDTAVASNAGAVALGSGSVTAAAVGTPGVTIAGTPYVFQGTNPASTVSVGAVGAERTITNVAAGRISGTSTDAINGSQLFATNSAIDVVSVTANKGWNTTTAATGTGTVTGTSTANVAPGALVTTTAGNNIAITQSGTNLTIATNPDLVATSVTTGNTTINNAGLTITGGPSVTSTGINAGNTVITNVAPGVAGTDATNVNQLNAVSAVANAGWNVTTAATGTGTATGTTVQNIAPGATATYTAGNNIAITQNGAEVQIATSSTPTFTNVTTGGLTATGPTTLTGGTTIGGSLTVNPGTTVNMGNNVITNVAPGVVSATSTDAVNGSQLNAVTTTANKGWNLSANGEATPQNIAPGATADFANGSNTTVTRTGNQIRVDVVADPTFNSVTTGNTRIDNTGLTIVGGPSVTTTGINAGGTQITNVAAGTAATDAVNLTQLNTTVAGSKTKYYSVNSIGGGNEDNLGATGADAIASGKGATAAGASSVAMGLGATASTANSVALGAGSATATAVGTPSTTINGTTYNFQGITPVGTVSVGSVGAERTITNVAAGRLSATSTDAINGSQLYQTNQAIDAATTTANKGWNLSANGEATPQNIAPGATADFANGSNTTVTRTGNQIRVDVVADPTFNSVTTGNTRIDNTGLTIVGGPSVTTTGINAGGTQITNVATGTAATDAVNLTQLNTAVAGSKTKYYSVNSVGGGNEDNLGATGADAIASGKDASATVAGSVAIGSGSVSDRAVASSTGNIPAGSSLIPFNTTDRTLVGALSVGSATTYRQITNVADGTQAQDAVTVRQLSGALQSFAVTPIQYFHANSTAADSLAIGAESVAVGPQTVVNGNNGVGIGNGAVVQQSAPGGIAIGQGATSHLADSIALGTQASAAAVQGVALGAGTNVTQAGGVALGAGSVASTAAGVAGYVPPTATDSQRIAIGATTSTLAAVSVGNAATGQFRQITGVAAGSADSDAVNVSQLRGVQGQVAVVDRSAVKYDTNPDGSINYNTVSMGGSNATGPVTVHNVAPGVAGTDAVNVNQLNNGIAGANAYTDARANALGGEIRQVGRNAYAGVAAAMAVQMPGQSLPGKTVMRIGYGTFKGESAVGVSFRRTAENNGWSVTGGVGISRAGPAATVGAEWVFN
ncbi:ESPR-type extended signal peptide-containing protein [Variovorax fucosicus]